jgi:hypothetical protein
MPDRKNLKVRLDNHEQILVATLDTKNKLLFHFVFVLNFAFFGALFLLTNASNFILLIFVVWIFICFFLLRRNYLKLSSAIIKGDALFISNTKGQTTIVYISSVKKIQRSNILHISLTTIKYIIDGKINKAYFISDRKTIQQPSFIIRFTKQYFKNKKANL